MSNETMKATTNFLGPPPNKDMGLGSRARLAPTSAAFLGAPIVEMKNSPYRVFKPPAQEKIVEHSICESIQTPITPGIKIPSDREVKEAVAKALEVLHSLSKPTTPTESRKPLPKAVCKKTATALQRKRPHVTFAIGDPEVIEESSIGDIDETMLAPFSDDLNTASVEVIEVPSVTRKLASVTPFSGVASAKVAETNFNAMRHSSSIDKMAEVRPFFKRSYADAVKSSLRSSRIAEANEATTIQEPSFEISEASFGDDTSRAGFSEALEESTCEGNESATIEVKRATFQIPSFEISEATFDENDNIIKDASSGAQGIAEAATTKIVEIPTIIIDPPPNDSTSVPTRRRFTLPDVIIEDMSNELLDSSMKPIKTIRRISFSCCGDRVDTSNDQFSSTVLSAHFKIVPIVQITTCDENDPDLNMRRRRKDSTASSCFLQVPARTKSRVPARADSSSEKPGTSSSSVGQPVVKQPIKKSITIYKLPKRAMMPTFSMSSAAKLSPPELKFATELINYMTGLGNRIPTEGTPPKERWRNDYGFDSEDDASYDPMTPEELANIYASIGQLPERAHRKIVKIVEHRDHRVISSHPDEVRLDFRKMWPVTLRELAKFTEYVLMREKEKKRRIIEKVKKLLEEEAPKISHSKSMPVLKLKEIR